MSARFHVSQVPLGDAAVLTDAEAHHLQHVMRGRVGDEVTLFDGQGGEYAARITRLGRGKVELAVLSRAMVDRELTFPLTLGVALPKGDRQTWLIEKGTELGVSCFAPLLTARSVAQPTDKALDRLRRAAIEAAKQCGRNRLPTIEAPRAWAEFVAAPADGAVRLVAHPGGESMAAVLRESSGSRAVQAAIGPEGGLTDDELAEAQRHGWRRVDLGSRILRVETAALAITAVAANLRA